MRHVETFDIHSCCSADGEVPACMTISCILAFWDDFLVFFRNEDAFFVPSFERKLLYATRRSSTFAIVWLGIPKVLRSNPKATEIRANLVGKCLSCGEIMDFQVIFFFGNIYIEHVHILSYKFFEALGTRFFT